MKNGNGLTGIKIMPDDVPSGATGVRYSIKMTRCDPEGPQRKRRILFGPHHLIGPGTGGGLKLAIESAYFSASTKLTDDARCPPWPPAFDVDQPSLWVRVGNVIDPRMAVGIKPYTKETALRFPRANYGVDGRPDVTSIDCISQRSVLGKTYEVALGRREALKIVKPEKGWGHRFTPNDVADAFVCDPLLPAGEYAKWRVQLSPTYKWDAVVPAAFGMFVNPAEAASLFSEFWQEDEAIAFEVWGFAIKSGHDWRPLKRVHYHFHPGRPEGDQSVPYGPRMLKNGHLELSNDRPASEYLPAGSIIALKA